MAEYVALHLQIEHAPAALPAAATRRAQELEARMRAWPRTAANDPFWAASLDLAHHLAEATGNEVLVGFNEFCGPDIEEAIAQAADRFPDRIVVATPMLTQGGEHAERDIPAAIERARVGHPDVPILYAWPFDPADVARFLASQIRRAGASGRVETWVQGQ
jgi:sirohydrochlorin cobaltochelatase